MASQERRALGMSPASTISSTSPIAESDQTDEVAVRGFIAGLATTTLREDVRPSDNSLCAETSRIGGLTNGRSDSANTTFAYSSRSSNQFETGINAERTACAYPSCVPYPT